jgi:hypothetical protein
MSAQMHSMHDVFAAKVAAFGVPLSGVIIIDIIDVVLLTGET